MLEQMPRASCVLCVRVVHVVILERCLCFQARERELRASKNSSVCYLGCEDVILLLYMPVFPAPVGM